MKLLFSFIIIFNIILFSSTNELIDLYRSSGGDALLKKAEQLLKSKNYWLSRLENYDTDFGYYENIEFLMLTNKDFPTLEVYKFHKNSESFELIEMLNAYVGEKKGAKTKKGDKKTPTGVYKLVKKITKLNSFYGPLAFVTSYPNLFDRLKHRTGFGIWIHGLPLSGNREKKYTRGCIAIENENLKNLNKKIDLKKTIFIISDDKLEKTKKDDLALILSSLYKWLDSWKKGQIKKYLNFYNKKSFKKHNGKDFQWFKKYKTKLFLKKGKTFIYFSQINITPYPNIQNKKFFYISLLENYQTNSVHFIGLKELYVEILNNKMKIFIEK
jgi:murein L,D-transpeptidase YafK